MRSSGSGAVPCFDWGRSFGGHKHFVCARLSGSISFRSFRAEGSTHTFFFDKCLVVGRACRGACPGGGRGAPFLRRGVVRVGGGMGPVWWVE